jgi:hypothetical protein
MIYANSFKGMTWFKGKKINNAAHPTLRRVTRKNTLSFLAMFDPSTNWKKRVWVLLKKTSPSTQIGHDYVMWYGSTGTTATAPAKNGDGPSACPHPAASCPDPLILGARRRRRQRLRCGKGLMPVFHSGLQRSGSGDLGLVRDPHLATSVLQTRWAGNTGS